MSNNDDVCHCCLNDRKNTGKKPRPLIAVEVEGFDPYLICGFCDGDAILSAKALEHKPASE